jgi:hypothetical protein
VVRPRGTGYHRPVVRALIGVTLLSSACTSLLGISDPTPATPGDGGPDSSIDSSIDAPPPCAPAVTLNAEQTSALGAVGTDFIIGRFNNGLEEDIVVATGPSATLMHGDRTGVFGGDGLKIVIPTAGDRIVLGDWDLNVSGDDDLAFFTSGGASVIARRQNRANDPPVEAEQPLMGPNANVTRVLAEELGGNGNTDLLVYDNSGSRVFTASGLTAGDFIRSATTIAPVGDELVLLRQIDGQQRADAVFVNGSTVKLAVQSNANVFTNPINIAVGANSKGIAFGRFDADTSLDLVVSTSNGLTLFRQLSPGNFTMFGAISPVQSATPMLVGDVNEDGLDDILTPTAAILQCANAGGVGIFTQVEPLAVGSTAKLVDVNGDTKPDLVRLDGTNVKVRLQ